MGDGRPLCVLGCRHVAGTVFFSSDRRRCTVDVTIIQAQLQRDYDEVRTCAARCLRKARRFKDQDRSPDLYEWFMGRYTAFRY